MTEKYKLTQIKSDKSAKWNWKINMECNVCGEDTAVCTCLFETDDKLVVGLICEGCWNKYKVMGD